VDVVLLTLHHIVSDGWSMGTLMAEIGQVYESGDAGALAPLGLQYIDYTQWQNRLLAGESLRRQEAYWLDRLGGELPRLELPADRPRPAVLSYRGQTRRYQVDAALAARLRALARQHNATLFMTLLAGFKVLLGKLSGQTDLLVGTPIAGRRDPALEKLVGFFVNTLVLRTQLSGNPSFAQVLGRVRDTALGAWAHQDYPFDQLVETLNPPRDLGRQPIFTVLFTVQNEIEALTRQARFGGLGATAFTDTTTFAKFDLSVYVAELDGGLAVQIEYATDLFDAQRIDRLFAQYERLLAAVGADAQQRIGQLTLLGEDELRQVLVDFNPAAGPLPAVDGVHRLFEAQARRAPQRVALVQADATLSYGELDARANRLARQLQQSGVGAEDSVALLVDRSAEAVVAMLAVLKAGGCYVPLDAAYPAARLRLMAGDSRARVLLAQACHIKAANRLLWDVPTPTTRCS
jgi:non-ribosomal peptide synthetase component F